MLYALQMEIKKILRKKNLCIFLFAMFLVYMVYLPMDIFGMTGTDSYSYQAYLKLMENIDKENLSEEIEILQKNEENFSQADLYTDNYSSEQKLYDEVLKQAVYTLNYREMIHTTIENAQTGSVSLFQENAYINREQEKVLSDYERLLGISVDFSSYRGIHILAKADFADVFLLIVVILLVAAMLTMEKEEGTWSLLYTTYHGRKRVCVVKFLSGGLLLCICVIVSLFYKWFVVFETYGIGDVGNAIQSVYQYADCKYLLSIGEFLALCFAGRLLAYMFFYALLFWVAVFFYRSMALYGITGIFLGVEFLSYEFLSDNSWLGILKQLNIFQFISSDEMISEYRNVNIFQFPVDYLYVAFVTEIVVFLIFAILGIYCAERYTESKKNLHLVKKPALFNVFHITKKKAFCPSNLFLFMKELKKVWIGEKGYALFVLACIILFVSYSPAEESFADKNQVYYQSYIRSVEGKYSDEKLENLLKERGELKQLEKELNSEADYTMAQRDVMQNRVERLLGLDMAIQNVSYIRDNKVGYIVYEKGYLVQFGKMEGRMRLLFLRMLSVLFMVGFAAFVWGVEEWSGTTPILKCSLLGKCKLRQFKRLHIFVLAVLIFVMTYIPWIKNVITVYDCNFWQAPFNSILSFEGVSFQNMSLAAGALIFWGIHLLYLYCIGDLVCFIQKKLKGYILTVFVAFVLFVVPILLV